MNLLVTKNDSYINTHVTCRLCCRWCANALIMQPTATLSRVIDFLRNWKSFQLTNERRAIYTRIRIHMQASLVSQYFLAKNHRLFYYWTCNSLKRSIRTWGPLKYAKSVRIFAIISLLMRDAHYDDTETKWWTSLTEKLIISLLVRFFTWLQEKSTRITQ